MPESCLASTYGGWKMGYVIQEYAKKFKEELNAKFPGQKYTVKEFQECYDSS